MKVLIVTVGSRGDAEPFCALAEKLCSKAHEHEVDLFLQTDLQYLVRPSDEQSQTSTSQSSPPSLLRIHDLPFTQMDFYKFVGNPSHGAGHANPRVQFLGVVTDVIGELVLPCTDKVLHVATTNASDIIVTSSLSRPMAMALGTKLDIPVCVVHLQALCPTSKFPHYSQTNECIEAILDSESAGDDEKGSDFEQSYWELEQYQHEFLKDRLDTVCANVFGLPAQSFDDESRRALAGRDGGKTLIVNAFQEELIPSCLPNAAEETQYVFDIGPLADSWYPNNAPSLESNEQLMAFLSACEHDNTRPICIGYGSMPFGGIKTVLETLKQVSRKALLVGDALKVPEDVDDVTKAWTADHVFHVSSVPYPQLLPHCAMMLSHGGAGVVNATLRAGIPSVISPLIGDQFFHAKLLERKNLGVQAGQSLTGVTKDELIDAIERASLPSCVANARDAGERIRSKQSGVERLVDVLETHLKS